ncbi:MAG: hypothetical protein V4693_18175 [Pseudomonadota bacterium]
MKPLITLCAAVAICASQGAAAACSCGPTYCVDTPEYRAALAKKKAAATAKGYPARMVALYDKLDHCEAGIRTSPDGFSILHQPSSGQYTIDGWTRDHEKSDASSVAAGTMKACHVILSQRAFACCGAKPPEERPDYNKELQLSTAGAIPCEK